MDLRFYPKGRLHGPAHRPQERLTLVFIALSALEEHHEFVALRPFNGKGGGVASTPLRTPFGGQFEILGPEITPVDDEEILAPPGHHEGAGSKVAKIPRI